MPVRTCARAPHAMPNSKAIRHAVSARVRAADIDGERRACCGLFICAFPELKTREKRRKRDTIMTDSGRQVHSPAQSCKQPVYFHALSLLSGWRVHLLVAGQMYD